MSQGPIGLIRLALVALTAPVVALAIPDSASGQIAIRIERSEATIAPGIQDGVEGFWIEYEEYVYESTAGRPTKVPFYKEPGFLDAMKSRLVGSSTRKMEFLRDNPLFPWIDDNGNYSTVATGRTLEGVTVTRVLQQVDWALFDAERKMFVFRDVEGRLRDLASLAEVMAGFPPVQGQSDIPAFGPLFETLRRKR